MENLNSELKLFDFRNGTGKMQEKSNQRLEDNRIFIKRPKQP